MSDPHKRRTPQNTRGMNDLITKREAYHGTQRMIAQALRDARIEWNAGFAEHIEQYHTPAWRKLWRRITRRVR